MNARIAVSSRIIRISLGPGNHVDVHFTEYHLLGRATNILPGTDDLSDLGMLPVP